MRTRNTTVEVYGVLPFGSRCRQFPGKVPACEAIASISWASASVTTSASSPSITARAWAPEPPCDIAIVTVCPVSSRQCSANVELTSL